MVNSKLCRIQNLRNTTQVNEFLKLLSVCPPPHLELYELGDRVPQLTGISQQYHTKPQQSMAAANRHPNRPQALGRASSVANFFQKNQVLFQRTSSAANLLNNCTQQLANCTCVQRYIYNKIRYNCRCTTSLLLKQTHLY